MVDRVRRCFSSFLVVWLVFLSLSFGQQPDSLGSPVPKLIKLNLQSKGYMRVLGGPPESSTMRSGLVALAPGKSVGKHSTERYEEMVIVFEGKGEMRITGGGTLSCAKGDVMYCPPHTEHDVVNTGQGELRYLYVVAQARPE